MANPGGFTNQVADLLLGGPKVEPQEETVYITDSTVLKRFAGRYYSERGDRLEMFYHDGRLNRHNPNAAIQLSDIGNGRYKMMTGSVIITNEKSWQGDSLQSGHMETPN